MMSLNRRKTLSSISNMNSPNRIQNRNRYSLLPNRMNNENLSYRRGVSRQSINIYKPPKSSFPLNDYNPRYYIKTKIIKK